MNPFFVMPASALLSLREELELLEGEWAGETLERTGFKAGMTLVQSLEVPPTRLEDFSEVFTQLWSESGLSRTKVQKVTGDEIVVTFNESVEASRGRRCDFTRGYVAGITSALLGRKYKATEVVCMCQGAEKCVHHLVPNDVPLPPVKPVVTEATERKYRLESGCAYLIESEDSKEAFEIFVDYLAHGSPGLCISREFPEKLRKAYRLDGAQLIWLSYESDIGNAREPTNIPLIYSEIKSFLEQADDAVFLISGLEYLVSQNNFSKVLKFVQLLSEAAAVTDSVFLLPISPGALTPREVKVLEREFRDIKSESPSQQRSEMLKLED
jgi:predicted hydrocarbon binding protein